MADLTPTQAAVLQVLSWQTPDYLCSPFASAFVSQGLEDPNTIEKALAELEKREFVEFFTVEESTDIVQVEKDNAGNPVVEDGAVVPLRDEEGNLKIETIKQTVDSGWVITDAGRAEVK